MHEGCRVAKVFSVQRVRDALVSEREALLEGLREIPFLQPFPSQANFVLCKVRRVLQSTELSGCARAYSGFPLSTAFGMQSMQCR